MKDLNLINIAEAINGVLVCDDHDRNKYISGAVIDSRLVEKDYLFFAVKGAKVDGHDFIDAVFEKGALAVVTEKDINVKPYIKVESTLEALKMLAKYYRSRLDIPVVGISGSVGKTSTKEFVASVLSEKYNVLKTEGNFNNEIGLPLTILKIREEHELAVIEMGISDFGEMTRLAEIAVPDVCVITNIGMCHLENLIDRDGVFKAKTEMLSKAKENCEIVLNFDDDKLAELTEYNGKATKFFSINKDAYSYATDIVNKGIEGTNCNIYIGNDNFNVDIHIPGIHMVNNALAATVVGNILGLDISSIKNGIEKLYNAAGRVNIIKKNYCIIDDCYNANPVSMKAAIDLLKTAGGRKIAVVGDMFELGENEVNIHREIARYIKMSGIDYVFATGQLSKNLVDEYNDNNHAFWFESIDGLIDKIVDFVEDNDTVLVKASHSMHFEKIVKALN